MIAISKKITAIIIIVVVVFAACSCNIGGLSDEEARHVLEEKLPASLVIIDIIYGKGLPTEEAVQIDPTWTFSHYFAVAADCGYTKIEDIKAKAEKVFSKEYLATLYEYAFDGNDQYRPRYSVDTDGRLTIDVTKKPMNLLTDIYTDTAVVVKGTKFASEINVETSTDGGKTRKYATIKIINQDGVWLFDGPTY